MKRKTLGKLFAVTAAGLITVNAPMIVKAEEHSEEYSEKEMVVSAHTEDETKTEQNESAGDSATDDRAGNSAGNVMESTADTSTDSKTDNRTMPEKNSDTEEIRTEEGGKEEIPTKEGDTEEIHTEEIYTEDGDTEEGDTEEIHTKEGDTEEIHTDKGSTEEGSAESHVVSDGDRELEGSAVSGADSKEDEENTKVEPAEHLSADQATPPADFAEAAERLEAAEKEAEAAQIELDKIQTEISTIQTGEAAAREKVEETGEAKKQAEQEQTRAEAAKKEADTAVSDAEQTAKDAQTVWDSTINSTSDSANALQAGKEQLEDKKTEVMEAESAVEELETECANKEKEADNAELEKNWAEASAGTKQELKDSADKALSNAQAEVDKAQQEYEFACEAEKSQGAGAGSSEAGSTEVEINEAVNALTAAKEKAASGALGFFEYLAEAEDSVSARAAIAILTSRDGAEVKGLRPSYVWSAESWEHFYSYTHIGDENDATSLENMKRAIAFIEECNQLRTTDNNFPDCEPLVVNDAVMAVAQLNANWATYTNGSYHSHAAVFNTNENLAWYYLDRPGSDDPFEGWYDQEKAIYDSKGSGVTGHYLNIANKDLSATGFGVNLSKDSSGATRINCAQEFIREAYYGGYGFGETYTVEEYRDRFNQYYYQVMTELSNAQAAYDRVSGAPGAQTAAKKAALYQAKGKLESAKNDAEKAQNDLNQALRSKTECEQKYIAAREALEQSAQALEAAKSVLEQRRVEYQALEQEMRDQYGDTSDAMIALTDAEAAYQKALLAQEKAAGTLEKAQAAYREASDANTEAIHEWNNITSASIVGKEQELKAAQDRYAQAFENLCAAQGFYDMLNPNQGNVIPSGGGSADQPGDISTPDEAGKTEQPVKPGRPVQTTPSGQAEPFSTVSGDVKGSNVTMYTELDQSTRATISKDCSFANFVRTSADIFAKSTDGKLLLDCSNTPWFSLSRKALLALENNSNTQLTILYRFGGKKYMFTIPAGFDFSQLQDANGWYGFMYLKMVFGGHEA